MAYTDVAESSRFHYIDPADLKVDSEQLNAFSEAIVTFWRNVPESIYYDDGVKVPGWLGKAFENDASNKGS